MSELSIKLRIGNREYPMRIRAEDEERIRLAGRILNKKLKHIKKNLVLMINKIYWLWFAFDCQNEKMKGDEGKMPETFQLLRE